MINWQDIIIGILTFVAISYLFILFKNQLKGDATCASGGSCKKCQANESSSKVAS